MEDTATGVDALDVLADETRLDILRALAGELASDPENRSMRFADLRKAVGVRDSGNFSYHLDKLTGWLVEETDDGYRLTPRGTHVLSTLAAGIRQEESAFEPEELDRPCPTCGADVTATYEDGTFLVRCDNDHGVADILPANVLDDRPVEDVLELMVHHARRYIRNVLSGFCALCEGPVDRTEYRLEEHDSEHVFYYACQRCGTPFMVPPEAVGLVHPATTWFAYERGVDVWDDPWLLFEVLMDPDSERVQTDPPRYEATFEFAGDALTFTIDDEPSVVDVTPSPDGTPRRQRTGH